MRILQVNKSNYPRGGADVYFLFLQKALRDEGHEVAVFAMDHPDNEDSPWQKYFVSRVSFNEGGWENKLKTAGRVIYSREAARKFGRLLDDFRPDIIHCHNIYHQLSPSILVEAKKRGIPLIMHLHDYKLICPNYRLFSRGRICQDCLDKKGYWSCVKNNCFDSYPRSFLAYLEMTVHHKLFNLYEDNLDLLIAPSRFMRKLMLENGWPAEKVRILVNPTRNIVDSESKRESADEESHFLYFGRLSPEKGIETLIAAAQAGSFDLRLAGSGKMEPNLKKKYGALVKNGRLNFLGQLSGQRLADEIARAAAIVIPSIWLENMPLALLESLAAGKIVIASRLGGLAEMIQDGENGFLFKAGDVDDLQTKMKIVLGLTEEQKVLIRDKARQSVSGLSPTDHIAALLKIYLRLVKKSD
jgi:glycosyltransferase involved in cell wall biosynthesis